MLSLGYVHLGNLTIVGFAQNTSSIYTMRILHFWIRLISFHFKTCSAETILKEKSYFQRINITWNICIFVTSHNIIPNIEWKLKKRMIGILWWHALYKNKKIFVPNSVFVILFWDAYQLITHPTVLFLLRIHCSKMRNSLEQCAERPRELIVWAYKWNANMHYLLLCTGTTG